jgi:hypothetical protein
MTTFNELSDVNVFKNYKAGIKTALGRLKAGATGVNFVYFEKFKFDDKERPLVLIDHGAKVLSDIGKTHTALGKCKVDDDDRIVFEASTGKVHVDKAQRLFTEVGVPRAVADPDAPKSASAKPLEGEKLNMTYGWTEMRTWGAEAAALIEKFDGLVGLYKSIPEIKPEWTVLEKRYEAVKQDMAGMVKTNIVNTPKARTDHQKLVEAQIETVTRLIADIRKEAAKPVPKQPSTAPTATQKEPEKVASQPAKEEPKPATTTTQPASKPALTTKELQTRVAQTVPVKGKDNAEKYAARMERELRKEFADVSADQLKAIKLLAAKAWFTKAEEAEESAPAEAEEDTLVLTADQKRMIDEAMQAAKDVANGPAEMIDNDAQTALGDAITAAIGGNYPTHSRGGGHKGSFNKAKSVQQQLSNIGGILQPKVRDAINEHLAAQWGNCNGEP